VRVLFLTSGIRAILSCILNILLIPFPRLPQSSAGSRNTGYPCSSLLSCTDELLLI
jgi:hypothetical protein